jgi:uncharacterized protein (TIGR03437 family)
MTTSKVTADVPIHFEGKDADGTKWTRDVTLTLAPSPYTEATTGMTAVSVPATVQQNPKADAACQYSHRIVVQETGGFLMQMTVLKQGTTDLSSQIQQIFGTTHLAPWGTLQGDVCFAGSTAPGAKTYTVSGITEYGNTLSAAVNVTLAAAPAAAATATVAPQAVTLGLASSARSATTSVALSFTGGSPAWTTAVVPGAAWLTVGPASGTGSGTLNLTVNSTGLSSGAYTGTVLVLAADTVPQSIQIPVTFVVGASGSISIAAIANGASYAQAFAPGTLVTVFGTGLAGTTASASVLPLPLALGGVSATVNGISAPLYYVSATQINVQIPYETGAGPAVLGINNGGLVASFPFTVAAAAPGLFTAADGTLAPSGTAKQGAVATAYITGDGDTTTFLMTGDSPATGTATSKLPKPKLPLTVTVGGVTATVSFAGIPPGLVGVTQINFTVPAGAPLGSQPVVVTVGTAKSQTARMIVTQ